MTKSNHHRLFSLLAVSGTLCLICLWSFSPSGLTTQAGVARFKRLDRPSWQDLQRWQRETDEQQQSMGGGEHFKPLKLYVEFPGIEPRELELLSELELPSGTAIVGVRVEDEACAFVLSSMMDPMAHIVNLVLNDKPISVAYCDLVDEVRVCTSNSSRPISLDVGGLDVDDQLVLLYRGKRYGQGSDALPLTDHAHERTTVGEWLKRFPDSKAYVAPKVDW